MSRLNLLILTCLFTCRLCLTSCLDDDNDKIRDKVSYIEMTVASQTLEEEAYPFLSSVPILTEYLRVKKTGDTQWSKMGLKEIAGFNYQDGREYLLKVKQTELAEPMMDGPSVTYELEEILSTTHVDKGIHQVERYLVGEIRVIVVGESLSESEKDEIARDVRIAYPDQGVYRLYKFIYPPEPPSTVIRYTGTEKEEGSLTVAREEFGGKTTTAYYLQLGEEEYTYYFYQLLSGGRGMSESVASFTEDLTEVYRADYPGVEFVWCQQQLLNSY